MRWRRPDRDPVLRFYEESLASVRRIQESLPGLLSQAGIGDHEFQGYALARAQVFEAGVHHTQSADERLLASAALMLASFPIAQGEPAEDPRKSMERVYDEEWVSPLRDIVASGRRSIGKSRRRRLELQKLASSKRSEWSSKGGLEARRERVARDAVLLMTAIYLDR
jgi:hypothetical protein